MGLGRITRSFFSTVTFGLISPPKTESYIEKITREAGELVQAGKLMQAQLYIIKEKAQSIYSETEIKTLIDQLLDEIDSKCIPLEVQPGEVKFIQYTSPIPLSKRLWICERKDLPEDYLKVHTITKGVTHLIIDNESISSGKLLGFKGLWDICSDQAVVAINNYVGNRFAQESIGQAEGLILARRQKSKDVVEICITKTTPPSLKPTKDMLGQAQAFFLASTVNEYE